MDRSSKSYSCDDGEKRMKHVRDCLVVNEEAIEIIEDKDIYIERFYKDGIFSKRKWLMFGK